MSVATVGVAGCAAGLSGPCSHRCVTRNSSSRGTRVARGARVGGGCGSGGVCTSSGVANVWQHPFVDVFRTFGIDAAERKGDVVEELDRTICKRVLCIRGAVSANNFVRLPHPKSLTKSLGLTGEYIYLQMKDLGLKFFVVHFDFIVSMVNVLRITLSNMNAQIKVTSHSIQCPCQPMHRWTVVCVHVPSVLASCTSLPPHAFALKSVQFCASMFVRNIFTSDIRYNPDTLPKDMLLDNHGFEDRHDWINIPGRFAAELGGSKAVSRQQCLSQGDSSSKSQGTSRDPMDGKRVSPSVSASPNPLPCRSGADSAASGCEARFSRESADYATHTAEFSEESLPLPVQHLPDPMLEVSRLVGISRRNRRVADFDTVLPRRFAVFVRSGFERRPPAGLGGSEASGIADCADGGQEVTSCVLYAASMTLSLIDPGTAPSAGARGQPRQLLPPQHCFFGHSRAIEILEASDDGLWVASVQGSDGGAGVPPVLRLWRVEPQGGTTLRCTSVLSCPSLGTVRVAAFDAHGRHLVLVGADLQSRQQLLVWDIGREVAGGSATLIARQTSADWDMDCVRFSPFEELQVVTCGRDSIRFWRVKDGHMPGRSVVLNSLARQAHFTCIAFEFNKMGQPYFLGEHLGQHRRLFVGTANGKVLQLSYQDRTVQIVYQLHNEAITSMCANEGFVVTASVDGYVRVWPLDFKSFYLHAMHDSPVVGVDISVDGLRVLCCSADGSVGILDMQGHAYTDLVRSHGASIKDAALSLCFQELVTASSDGILKVWSLSTMTQTDDFSVAGDEPAAVAFHPGDRHLFAAGFASGSMRVFDIDGPAMLCEHRHHLRPIRSLAFVADSKRGDVRIVTCDSTGALAFYDETVCFEVVRTPERALCAMPPDGCAAMVCMPPRLMQYLDPQHVALCAFPDLELVRKLRVPSSSVTSLEFSVQGARFAVLGVADSHVYLFSSVSGDLVVTYSLASGNVAAASALTPTRDCREASPLLWVATGDKILHLCKLRPEELCGGNLSAPRVPVPTSPGESASAAATNSQMGLHLQAPSPVIGSVPRGRFEEQCFIGHAVAPHRVLVSPSCVVTISSTEVICWSVVGNCLKHGFGDSLLREDTPVDEAVGSLVTEAREESPTLFPQRDEPSLVGTFRESAERDWSSMVGRNSDQLRQAEREPWVPPQDSESSVRSPLSSQPQREQQPSDASFEVPATALSSGSADSSHMNAAGVGVECLREGQPENEVATVVSSSGFPTENEVGAEQSVESSLPRCGDAGCVLPPEMLLVGVSGVSTLPAGIAAVAWQPMTGVLCHVVAGAVYLERLSAALSQEAMSRVAPEGLVAQIPNFEAFAVDLDPAGGPFLCVLSGACGKENGGVRLSLWRIGDLSCESHVDLPEVYEANWRRCQTALATSDRGDRETKPATHVLPVMRLWPGGSAAVTAATADVTDVCRVDIWDLGSFDCLLRCSGELPYQPLDIAVSAGGGAVDSDGYEGGEFVTLCAGAVVFWRIPCASEVVTGEPFARDSASMQLPTQLQLQFAESPEVWAEDVSDCCRNGGFRRQAMCMAVTNSVGEDTECQGRLLFVAGSDGRIWAYDVDENRLVGELRLLCSGETMSGEPVECTSVEALACGRWPTLVCARGGGVIRAFGVREDTVARGSVVAVAVGPALHLDGPVRALILGGAARHPAEGVASTVLGTIWYFNIAEGVCVQLQSFHGVPSRMLRSNALLDCCGTRPRGGGDGAGACDVDTVADGPPLVPVPPVLASSADDGSVRIWRPDTSKMHAQALAEFKCDGACTAISFIRSDLLACAFSSGCICLFSICDLAVAARVEAREGGCPGEPDPLLALEVTGPNTVVCGSGSGHLVELTFQLARRGCGWAVTGLRRSELRGPRLSTAIFRIERGGARSAQRLLVCYAALEVWLWECNEDIGIVKESVSSAVMAGRGMKHTHTWIWPESTPRPSSSPRCSSLESCLEMLASPPLVAQFVGVGADLVAVTAPPARCLYIYSCSKSTIMNRVTFPPNIQIVQRFLYVPYTREWERAGGSVHDFGAVVCDDALLLVLCLDRFFWIRLGDHGRRASLLGDAPRLLPGTTEFVSVPRGTPDACLLPFGDTRLRGGQLMLMKGDRAISFWLLPSSP